MKVEFTKIFQKQYKKLPRATQDKFKHRLQILCNDPQNPALRNHALIGKYHGCRSINVTGDVRAIYSQKGEEIIIMLLIGTHSQLYK